MAENELDGFDNLDDLFSEDQSGGGGDAAAGGGDLDALLGDAPAEGGGGGGGEGGGSDSELDSFFEDLSTIDDLEVAQEEAPAAPDMDDAAPMAAAAEPATKKATAPAKPKAKKAGGGKFKKFLFTLVFLGVIGAAAYWFLFPSEEVPWEVTDMEEEMMEEVPVQEEEPPPPPPKREAAKPQPPPPPPPQQAAPEPAPRPAPAPAPPTGRYTIQVATCFFPSCVQQYQGWLKAKQIDSRVRQKSQSRETLEIYTSTTFSARSAAQEMAERINRDNRMEGRAYVLQEGSAFRVSMGNFTDLGRANIVRDALNQRMAGEVSFATRVKQIPYTLHNVVGGRYTTRAAAEAAREKLAAGDPHFKDAFVTAF